MPLLASSVINQAATPQTTTMALSDEALLLYDQRITLTRTERLEALEHSTMWLYKCLWHVPPDIVMLVLNSDSEFISPQLWAAMMTCRYYGLLSIRALYFGGKICALLRRNVRERTTRPHIIALAMQRCLGKHGAQALWEALPYMAGASTSPAITYSAAHQVHVPRCKLVTMRSVRRVVDRMTRVAPSASSEE
jgi:hypothetical protein